MLDAKEGDMSNDQTLDLPEGMEEPLRRFKTCLSDLERAWKDVKKDIEQNDRAAPLERGKSQFTLAYALNSLFYMHLLLHGKDPEKHDVKQELSRIQKHFKAIDRAEHPEKYDDESDSNDRTQKSPTNTPDTNKLSGKKRKQGDGSASDKKKKKKKKKKGAKRAPSKKKYPSCRVQGGDCQPEPPFLTCNCLATGVATIDLSEQIAIKMDFPEKSEEDDMNGVESKGSAPRMRENDEGRDAETKCTENADLWRRRLDVGSVLDVLEPMSLKRRVWCPAKVVSINRGSGKVFVTFTDWTSKFDEWIDRASPRLKPHGTHVYLGPQTPLTVGQRIDVFDEHPCQRKHIPAIVIEEKRDSVKVHFEGYQSKFDEWISRESGRIRPFRHNRRPRSFESSGQTKSADRKPLAGISYNTSNNRIDDTSRNINTGNLNRTNSLDRQGRRALLSSDPRFRHFQEALRRLGLAIVKSRGDGNCLFRSIAHLVYGDDTRESADGEPAYKCVRHCAVQYMKSQRRHFEPFITGLRIRSNPNRTRKRRSANGVSGQDAESSGKTKRIDVITNECKRSDEDTEGVSFDEYVSEMSRDGTWGDDPEITAMCELYDRPAEIYVYDSTAGAKLMKTFHETRRRARVPLRLSYYGGGHYDAIVPVEMATPPSTLRTKPGAYERRRIEMVSAASLAASTSALSDEQQALRQVMELTRSEYERGTNVDLDIALERSLSVHMDATMRRSAEDEERRRIEEAKRVSLAGASENAIEDATASKFDADTASAMKASLAAASADSADDTEDAMLAAAIAASKESSSDSDDHQDRDNHHIDLSKKKLVSSKVANAIPNEVISCDLSENAIDSLDFWRMKKAERQLASLKRLNLSRNNISDLHVGCTSQYHHLRVLDLSYNFIDSIDNLSFAPGLERLNLSYNWISSVKGLEHLKRLRTLDIGDNLLETSSSLRTLTFNLKLRRLRLHGNPISKSSGYAFVVMNVLPQVLRVDTFARKKKRKKTRRKQTKSKRNISSSIESGKKPKRPKDFARSLRRDSSDAGIPRKGGKARVRTANGTLSSSSSSYASIHLSSSCATTPSSCRTSLTGKKSEITTPSTDLIVSRGRNLIDSEVLENEQDDRIVDFHRSTFDRTPKEHPIANRKQMTKSMNRRRKRALLSVAARRRLSIALQTKNGEDMLESLFREDADGTGLLPLNAVVCVVRECCEGMTDAESESIASLLLKAQKKRFPSRSGSSSRDQDVGVLIDYLYTLRQKLRAATYVGPQGQDLRVLFRRIDADHSDGLSRIEFSRALKRIVRLTDRELRVLWKIVDRNGDGRIDLSEFSRFVMEDGVGDLSMTSSSARRRRRLGNRSATRHMTVDPGDIPSPTSLDRDLQELGVLEKTRHHNEPKVMLSSHLAADEGSGSELDRETRDLEVLLERLILRKENALRSLRGDDGLYDDLDLRSKASVKSAQDEKRSSASSF
eukprot:g69.t1